MNAHLTKVSLGLLSAVFILGCQDLGSGPVGPDGLVPQFKRGGNGKPDSSIYSVDANQGACSVQANTWFSTKAGVPTGSSLSPRWARGDLTVTTVPVDGNAAVLLTGPAGAGVGVHKGEIDWVRLSIRDISNVQYTTGKIPFTTSNGPLQDDGSAPDGFTISGVADNNIVPIYPLTARGNKRGPQVGTICFGDLVYTRN